jgi:3-hydroxybutyryl-CoA dehydrogenase
MKRVSVVGGGQMGCGIVHASAQHGYEVVLLDKDDEKLSCALGLIEKNLGRQEKKGELTKLEVEETLLRIETSRDYGSVEGSDLVVEAVYESEKAKGEVYEGVRQYLGAETIVASNTSSLSITRLASLSGIPDRFVGIHFMNPVPLMRLVEMIRGLQTSDETFMRAESFALSLGKTVTLSGDFPAFIVNRVLLPMINEAIYILYEGVGTVESIDTSMKLGANHPMGPLQLADFIGLDICLSVMQVLYEGLSDSKYRPCPLLVKYYEAGWLGKKSGRGFYDYSGDVPVPTR